MENFEGRIFLLPLTWKNHINEEYCKKFPIKYLEIGLSYGANIIYFSKTFGVHPESEIHGIDPWEDYDEYPEYKNMQNSVYEKFLRNVENAGLTEKLKIHRGYSNKVIPTFENNYFDIIYIDGNHETDYVLEDAILCFRKLKKEGMMIFDDYSRETVKNAIDIFTKSYEKKIKILGEIRNQVFIEKL